MTNLEKLIADNLLAPDNAWFEGKAGIVEWIGKGYSACIVFDEGRFSVVGYGNGVQDFCESTEDFDGAKKMVRDLMSPSDDRLANVCKLLVGALEKVMDLTDGCFETEAGGECRVVAEQALAAAEKMAGGENE